MTQLAALSHAQVPPQAPETTLTQPNGRLPEPIRPSTWQASRWAQRPIRARRYMQRRGPVLGHCRPGLPRGDPRLGPSPPAGVPLTPPRRLLDTSRPGRRPGVVSSSDSTPAWTGPPGRPDPDRQPFAGPVGHPSRRDQIVRDPVPVRRCGTTLPACGQGVGCGSGGRECVVDCAPGDAGAVCGEDVGFGLRAALPAVEDDHEVRPEQGAGVLLLLGARAAPLGSPADRVPRITQRSRQPCRSRWPWAGSRRRACGSLRVGVLEEASQTPPTYPNLAGRKPQSSAPGVLGAGHGRPGVPGAVSGSPVGPGRDGPCRRRPRSADPGPSPMRSPTRLATWSEGRGGPLRGYITTGAAPWWYPRRNGRGRGPVDDPASQRQGDWRGFTESIDPNCIPVEGGRPSPTLSAPGRSGQSATMPPQPSFSADTKIFKSGAVWSSGWGSGRERRCGRRLRHPV